MIKDFKFLRSTNILSPECYLPEYYDTTNMIFSFVTPTYYEAATLEQFKFMVYRNRYYPELEAGRHRIGPTHPMYNFNGTR